VHGVLVAAHQARQRVDVLVGVPDLDAISEQPGLDPLVAQTTVHRIGVAVDVHQAARIDPATHLQARRQACIGKIPQCLQLLGEAVLPAGVPRRHQLLQEVRILLAAGEVATAAEQQRLFDDGLEVPVRRLGIAVLVRLSHIDALARQAVVCQQVTIAGLELARRRQVVHRGAEAITAVPARHAAQFPQRILQTIGQRLERLRGAHGHGFPIRVGQHEMINHVIERLAGNGNVEPVHGSEVGRRQIARLVDLAEHNGLPRSVRGVPLPYPAFKSAAVRIEKLARICPPQPVEERLGPQSRFGSEAFFNLGPNRGKRVEPRAVGPRHSRLLAGAGQRRMLAVMSGSFGAHACSPGRRVQGNSQIEFAVQASHLAIRNHRIPPKLRELGLWPDVQKEGILIVGDRGKPIDATQA
jgi:hypothetical protein